MSVDIKGLLLNDAKLTEEYLESIFSSGLCGDTLLRDACSYSVLGGGKRIRAFLTIEFCKAFGGNVETAIPFAAAIEMIHAFSLVHDDMPCMDNDALRRGKPSTHKAFGEAEALLCGDELFCIAFEVASSNKLVPAESSLRVIKEFSKCAGALGMMGGQHYDLCEKPQNYDELLSLHRMKTGALISASCLNGYYSACERPDENVCASIRSYAYSIGLAFQIIDDILDVVSDEKTLGKPIGSDKRQKKITSLSFMSIEDARNEAKKLTDQALEVISPYDKDSVLQDFARFLLGRTF